MRLLPEKLLVPILVIAACGAPRPGSALHEVEFVERPHILRRGDEFFLRYRVEALEQPPRMTERVVFARKTSDKAFYYFSVPTSSRMEWGVVVERPLATDGFTDHARRNAVYWLDPDGSETQLDITDAPGAP
jgi:hypothetical protein